MSTWLQARDAAGGSAVTWQLQVEAPTISPAASSISPAGLLSAADINHNALISSAQSGL